jgi:hypothetical protein
MAAGPFGVRADRGRGTCGHVPRPGSNLRRARPDVVADGGHGRPPVSQRRHPVQPEERSVLRRVRGRRQEGPVRMVPSGKAVRRDRTHGWACAPAGDGRGARRLGGVAGRSSIRDGHQPIRSRTRPRSDGAIAGQKRGRHVRHGSPCASGSIDRLGPPRRVASRRGECLRSHNLGPRHRPLPDRPSSAGRPHREPRLEVAGRRHGWHVDPGIGAALLATLQERGAARPKAFGGGVGRGTPGGRGPGPAPGLPRRMVGRLDVRDRERFVRLVRP